MAQKFLSNTAPGRFVLFDDAKGIYLGGADVGHPAWSLENPLGRSAAVTFSGPEELQKHCEDYGLARPESSRLVAVFPDRPDYKASPMACSTALLPGWDHTKV